MKNSITAALAALLLFILGGCVKTVYLEQETPAGAVPRARVMPSPGVEQGLQGAYQANAAATGQEKAENVAERFQKAYDKARQPRIALYLNRALSDEVREWKTNERIVVASQVKAQGALAGSTTGERPSGDLIVIGANGEPQAETRTLEGKYAAAGEISASRQVHVEDAARSTGPETWSWAFEDGFSQPFLAAGSRLVDRATILRLTAAGQGSDSQPAVKQVEMAALKEYADLLVEILVANRYQTGGNYEFKVSVKDVQSGRIVANATTLYPGNRMRSHQYVETSRGFESQGEDPYLTGRDLALDLMESLAVAWER
jgi:hypothetical protein